MRIQKDNLTPKQKKNTYLKIFFLVVIICIFFIYKSFNNNSREKLLAENFDTTFCEIIGNHRHKRKVNHIEYTVNGKKYESQPSSSRIYNVGEYYRIKYSKSNPEISEVDYTEPIIFDKINYENINGIITKIFKNERLIILSFSYNYKNQKYDRDVILKQIGELKKEKQVEILVNKDNPKISYLKNQIKRE